MAQLGPDAPDGVRAAAGEDVHEQRRSERDDADAQRGRAGQKFHCSEQLTSHCGQRPEGAMHTAFRILQPTGTAGHDTTGPKPRRQFGAAHALAEPDRGGGQSADVHRRSLQHRSAV